MANLVPYGPERPRSGMVKSAGTNQVDIFWDPPKGEFKKYTLLIERIGELFKKNESKTSNKSRNNEIRRKSTVSDVSDQSDVAGNKDQLTE